MRLVQARIPEADFQLLHRCAKDEGKSMQEIVREALHARLAPDAVDPNDPLFDLFPLTERRGKPHRLSEDHDDYLYGKRPR
ncbi:MAG: ribbon-helix-helix protein, CopG family [Euryarchaeota archaeon]|nr:ribbon-helix-helix protein, CopG family [Euryarchaeota archaeon]MDE2046739.1 ribbon-helix-helix protein, CopG family [Thermoplasmata archaeon]